MTSAITGVRGPFHKHGGATAPPATLLLMPVLPHLIPRLHFVQNILEQARADLGVQCPEQVAEVEEGSLTAECTHQPEVSQDSLHRWFFDRLRMLH